MTTKTAVRSDFERRFSFFQRKSRRRLLGAVFRFRRLRRDVQIPLGVLEEKFAAAFGRFRVARQHMPGVRKVDDVERNARFFERGDQPLPMRRRNEIVFSAKRRQRRNRAAVFRDHAPRNAERVRGSIMRVVIAVVFCGLDNVGNLSGYLFHDHVGAVAYCCGCHCLISPSYYYSESALRLLLPFPFTIIYE